MKEDKIDVKIISPEEAALDGAIRQTEQRIVNEKLSLEVDQVVLDFLKSKKS